MPHLKRTGPSVPQILWDPLLTISAIWRFLVINRSTLLIWSAHIISRVRSSTQSLLSVPPRTTSTLLIVVSLSRHQDSGTLFHWAVGLLHPLTFSRIDSRRSFSVCDSDIVARASVLWRVINLLIDWLTDWRAQGLSILKRRSTSVPKSWDILHAVWVAVTKFCAVIKLYQTKNTGSTTPPALAKHFFCDTNTAAISVCSN